ncbi:MAG: SGNH/GDSL hydrolase family protein, partial [Janthinobacterium lividum]
VGVLLAVLAVVTACSPGPGAVATSPDPTPSRAIRYLPLGDSITAGYPERGGYRTLLWQLLVRQDGDKIDFVGSQSSGPPDLGDLDNEGHGGWCIDGPCNGPGTDDVVAPRIQGWITQYRPDIVSIHLGTNDIKKGATGPEVAHRLDDLVGKIYAVDPAVYVILIQIVPARADVEQHDAYDAAIPAIAARYQAQGRKVTVVDMSRLLSVPVNYVDGTHPTQLGYDQMARALYPAVSEAYRTVG